MVSVSSLRIYSTRVCTKKETKGSLEAYCTVHLKVNGVVSVPSSRTSKRRTVVITKKAFRWAFDFYFCSITASGK